jgi:hypothetical protein
MPQKSIEIFYISWSAEYSMLKIEYVRYTNHLGGRKI